jgi:hypothetical protein
MLWTLNVPQGHGWKVWSLSVVLLGGGGTFTRWIQVLPGTVRNYVSSTDVTGAEMPTRLLTVMCEQ